MANTPSGPTALEFMIKLYPGGHFSGLLDEGAVKAGDELQLTGPYGVFTLRAARRGGCCSSAAARGWRRSCRCCGCWTSRARAAGGLYYGARTEADLFHLEQLERRCRRAADFVRARALGGRGTAGRARRG